MTPVETLAAVQRLLSDYVELNNSSATLQWGHAEARAVVDSRTGEMRAQYGNEKSIGTKAVSVGRGLEMPTVSELKYHIRLRELRQEHFKSDLMSDPVWGILLELLLGQIEYRQISIKSATIASRVPPTTAHRHIQRLEERGLLHRYPDVFDRRRTLLALTDQGLRAIAALFAESRGIALKSYGPSGLSLLPPGMALESKQAQ